MLQRISSTLRNTRFQDTATAWLTITVIKVAKATRSFEASFTRQRHSITVMARHLLLRETRKVRPVRGHESPEGE